MRSSRKTLWGGCLLLVLDSCACKVSDNAIAAAQQVTTTTSSALKRNSGSCWTRTELHTMNGTCGIEEDCSAPSGLGYRFAPR